jgi:hypothetical protein
METSNKNNLPPPPPGVIQAILSGFNAVANRAVVLLIPIVFDLFLWLGPRFSIYSLVQPFLNELERMPEPSQGFFENLPLVYEFFEGLNAFAALRTFPLGVFSLMSSSIALDSPFGQRQALEADGLLSLLAFVLVLTVLGWMLGGLYFYAVAQVVRGKKENPPTLTHALSQGILLSGLWSLLWIIMSVPIFIFMGVLMLISPALMTVLYFLVVLTAIWLAVPVFFSMHGVFLQPDNLFGSVLKSFRMARYALPSLGWFVIIAVVLSQGLGFLWRIAPADSWITLFGIFGNAFVSTALLAASFIYYRDLNNWVDAALAWMKARAGSVQA